MATPVREGAGETNEEGQRSIVRFCRVHDIAPGIIVREFFKFTDEERKRILSIVVDVANAKVPV